MLKKYFIRSKILQAILFGCIAWLSSCQKSAELFVPDPGQPNGADTNWVSSVTGIMPIASLKDSIALQPQTDSINSNMPDTMITANGIQLIVPANSLEKQDNTPIDGKMKLEFMALQKKGDLIRMNTPTLSDSAVLATVGTFFIRFTKNDNELQVKSSEIIQLSLPGVATGQQSKFYFGQLGQAGIYNWKTNTDPSLNYIEFGNNQYVATIHKLGWISAGYSLSAAFNHIELTLPVQYTNANTAAYVVLNNHQSVVAMIADASTKKFMSDIIPAYQAAKVVVISKQGNDYFAATQLFTSATGTQTVNLLPVKMSLASLNQMLDGL